MALASSDVSEATEHIRNVGGSLGHIVGTVRKVSDQITRIATAVDEQSATSGEVARNIEKIADIARQMETMSGDVLHETNVLAGVGEELRNETCGFKTRAAQFVTFDIAKTDHRVFVGKIASCLKGDISLDPALLPDHHGCRFGKWYDTEGRQLCSSFVNFRAIERPHELIPSLGRSAIESLVDVLVALRSARWPEDVVLGRTHYTVGLITGGVAPNVVPAHASAEVLFRTVGAHDEVRAVLADTVGNHAEVEEVPEVPPVLLDTREGYESTVFAYTTDIPLLGSWGTPLLLGPGSIHVAHTDHEHVRVDELLAAVDLYDRLASALLAELGLR